MPASLLRPLPWALSLSLIALSVDASAQRIASEAPPAERAHLPVNGSVRDAGTYHVATGTWTRAGSQFAAFGPDVIYSNTAQAGYVTSSGGAGGFAPGAENVDEGMIPIRGNPDFPLADRASYTVNCFEIGYCDLGTAQSAGWEIRFYESYSPCSAPPAAATASITLTGLPALGCWTIVMDLSGGQEFEMLGEGGGGPGTDIPPTFGWSYRYAGSDGMAPAGFLLAGDPENTIPAGFPGGEGTYYGPPSACGAGNTGLLTQDLWWIAGTANQCAFLGGYGNMNGCGGPFSPYSSFYMELFAAAGPGNASVGMTFCMANPNSTGVESTLALLGSDSAAANNLLLSAALPPNAFGVFMASQTVAFTPNFMGSDGNLCLGGTIGYFTAPGQVRNSGDDGVLLLDTQLAAWDLADIPEGGSSYAAAAGLSTSFQCWHRDAVNGVATSNFTPAVTVTWAP